MTMYRKKKGYKHLTPDEFISYMTEKLKGAKTVTYFKIQSELEDSSQQHESIKLDG